MSFPFSPFSSFPSFKQCTGAKCSYRFAPLLVHTACREILTDAVKALMPLKALQRCATLLLRNVVDGSLVKPLDLGPVRDLTGSVEDSTGLVGVP